MTSELVLPKDDNDIGELSDFALSFSGYAHAGGISELCDLWDRVLPLLNEALDCDRRPNDNVLDSISIEDIRACLFWAQRNARYHGQIEGDSVYDFFVNEAGFFIRALRYKINPNSWTPTPP